MSNSKSEDTSLDYIFDTFTVNGEGDCVVDRTSMQEAINLWHKEQQIKLIERIEGEVIGRDDRDYSQDNADEESLRILVATSTACNELRAEQRQALKKLKDNVINGGSWYV